MPNALTKKIGPLPAWGWIAAVGLGGVLYYRSQQNAANSTATSSATDPNAVDPSTGLTYGQEASLALGTGADLSSLGGGSLTPTTGSSTDNTNGSPSWQDIISGYQDIANAWQNIATSAIAGTPGPAGPAGPQGKPGKAGKNAPAKTVKTKGKTKTGGAKTSSTHRAPANPNENTAAQHSSHTTPPPARTRITVKTPAPKRPAPYRRRGP